MVCVSDVSDSVGKRGHGRDKCVKREGDGSCGIGGGTRRSNYLDSMGQNCVQTEPLRYTSHGRRGREHGVSVCECRCHKLAREPCHVWGGSDIC